MIIRKRRLIMIKRMIYGLVILSIVNLVGCSYQTQINPTDYNYDESLRMQITTKDTTYKLYGSDYYFENDTLFCEFKKRINISQKSKFKLKIAVNNINEVKVEHIDATATALLIGGVLIAGVIYSGATFNPFDR
jgi:hypothetical protein